MQRKGSAVLPYSEQWGSGCVSSLKALPVTLSGESPFAVLSPAPLPAEHLCDAVSSTQEPHVLPDVNFPPPALLWVSWNQLLRRAQLTLGNSSCVREQIPPRLLHFQWFLTNYPCPCQVSMGHPTTRERLLLLSPSLCLGWRWKGAEQLRVHLAGCTQPKGTQGHLGPGGMDHPILDVWITK